MISYKEYLNALIKEETTAGDVANVDSKLTKKVLKKKKPNCKNKVNEGTTPEAVLRKAGIKIKSSEMDDESYVILLYKKDDIEAAKDLLSKQAYEVSVVGKLLYIS